MRRAVRAIIIKDNKLLIIHRNKFGLEYDTLPGGKIELGETPEQALGREVYEETTIKFTNPRLIYLEHAGDPYGDQYIYLCEYEEGEPKLDPKSDEALIHKMGQNLYEPKWLALDELSKKPFRSEKLKHTILTAVQNGWPKETTEIS